MKDSTLADVVAQLRINNRLVIAQMKLEGSLNQTDLIKILAPTGTPPREIAELLNTSEATVRTALHRISKAKGGKGEGE